MSSVQPEHGLPERRTITADSFRALKLKLAGSGRRQPEPSLTLPEAQVAASPALPPPLPLPETETSDSPSDEVSLTSLEALVDLGRADAAVTDQVELATSDQPAPSGAEASATETRPLEAETIDEPAPTEIPDAGAIEPEPAVVRPWRTDLVERRLLEKPEQTEDPEAGMMAHALVDIMSMPTEGSLPQERALANDTLLRLIPRMPLKSLRRLAERVCLMDSPSQMLVRRLINHPHIAVAGPLLEQAMIVNDSELIAVADGRNPAKLKLMARRRIVSPALSEALIRTNDVDTLVNLVRNQGASFSIESMWQLTRLAADHPVLQAPLVTRADTPSPIAFQLFWRLPSELRRYVLSRFLTDSETITRILTMNREEDGGSDRKHVDLSLVARLADAAPDEAGEIYAGLTHVSAETGTRIAEDAGGEALTVALKAAGLTRAQFAEIVGNRADAEALRAIFDTLSFNKARVLLTYWDWAVKRTGPYARIAAS